MEKKELIKIVPLKELEVKVWESKDINEIEHEVYLVARADVSLKDFIKQEKAKFKEHILEYEQLQKRYDLIIQEFKNKVVEKIANDEGFDIRTKTNLETGEVKTILTKKFPKAFGFITSKTKLVPKADYEFPEKYYKRVLNKTAVMKDISDFPMEAFDTIEEPNKLSWLPKNIIKTYEKKLEAEKK